MFTYLHMCVCCDFVFDDLFRFPVLVYNLDIIDFILIFERFSARDDDLRLFTFFGYSSSLVSFDFPLVNLEL